MIILCDIGGTYIRLAKATDGVPQAIKKYKVADFNSLSAAIKHYWQDQTTQVELLIAAAGAPIGNVWKITNNPAWDIDLEKIKEHGWDVLLILNDFEAATYSLPALDNNDLKILKPGLKNNEALCLIGPGTGLGLGYFYPPNKVQKTHGGHMPIASLSDAHGRVIKDMRSRHSQALVFEHIVSGRGLKTLKELYGDQKALRLFHEFLGIFAAQSVIHGHAYGGLYLTGGVITGLVEDNQFDYDCFASAFHFNVVDCVKDDLHNTPIYYITDPYPALKGLIHAKSLSDHR